MTSITIPNGVTEIGNSAFVMCANLSGVVLPSGLEKIDFQAFRECALTNFTMPDTVTYLGKEVFYRCEQLRTAHLSTALTSLSEGFLQWLYGADRRPNPLWGKEHREKGIL